MNFFDQNLTKEIFLNEFWEKKPLCIPGAIEIPINALTEKDIFAMATDEYFETRLVQEIDNIKTLSHGPIDLDKISDKSQLWTLILHNLNLYNDFANKLEKFVEFAPKWLFDDVMCTYSTKNSSVGAHFDLYSVFILQISGQRRWRIQYKPDREYDLDQDVEVLKNFKHDEEYILNPGDLIYIPPYIAHEGLTTAEDSISFSIGFNALSNQKLLDGFLAKAQETFETDGIIDTSRYIKSNKNIFEIPQPLIDEIQKNILEKLSDKKLFKDFILSNMAKPKITYLAEKNMSDKDSYEIFKAFLLKDQISFDEFVQFTSFKEKDNWTIYINELKFDVSTEVYNSLSSLIQNKHLEHQVPLNEELYQLLYRLYLKDIVLYLT